MEPFRKGWFYVQDGAAKLAVLAAKPQPGITVLDACAAPGGKSFGAAIAMGDRGSVTACDIHPHKRKLLEAGAARLGLSIVHPSIQDSGTPREDFDSAFDLVIADVPCSGLGVIREKPDIRYKDEEPLTQLPRIQRRILETVSGYVKPGGTLLYSTCTLLERENEEVVSVFLETHPNFSLEPFSLPGPIGRTEGQITIWPQRYQLDGFFIARMRRRP